ncbi:Murein DD-endopeptidase MepS/Murein LD-carboxypeptidase precursor, partial [Haemophilus influenzae]
MLKRILV